MDKAKSNENGAPGIKEMVISYLIVFSIMLMLFGSLLLPSTHIIAHDQSLVDEFVDDVQTSTYTPFVNNEFIFYWSPIDPLYDQADTEQNCPWGIQNGLHGDDNNGQTNQFDCSRVVGLHDAGQGPAQ